MNLAREGAPEGLVVVADHQSLGRGRAGRTWQAPPGASLLCTVLLRPPANVASLVTFALAVSAAEAIEDIAWFSPGLKWPNDLVVEDDGRTRKLAGILAEAEWPHTSNIAGGHRPPSEHERAVVAAGIGINVAWPEELPDELSDIAVAINHIAGRAPDRWSLLETMLDRLDLHYGRLVDGHADAVLDAWCGRSATLGRQVRIDLGSEDLEGTAVDVTESGQLIVETLEGERRTLAVGDVVHLREKP